MRIPHCLWLTLVAGFALSACAAERPEVPADEAQPSTTAAAAPASPTTVPGGEVTEPQATTPTPVSTVAGALELADVNGARDTPPHRR